MFVCVCVCAGVVTMSTTVEWVHFNMLDANTHTTNNANETSTPAVVFWWFLSNHNTNNTNNSMHAWPTNKTKSGPQVIRDVVCVFSSDIAELHVALYINILTHFREYFYTLCTTNIALCWWFRHVVGAQVFAISFSILVLLPVYIYVYLCVNPFCEHVSHTARMLFCSSLYYYYKVFSYLLI